MLVNQSSASPTRKVTAGVLGGSAATVLIWAASLCGITLPTEVSAAITTIASFSASYIAKEKIASPDSQASDVV